LARCLSKIQFAKHLGRRLPSYKSLQTAGVDIEGERHTIYITGNYELWMTFFRDPEGNIHAVQEERGRFAP
jgi:hypothetical protein